MSQSRDELYELIEAACEGQLSAERLTRLQSLLASDEEAARIYVRCLSAEALLERFSGSDGLRNRDLPVAVSPSLLMGEGSPAVSSTLRLRPEGSLSKGGEGASSVVAGLPTVPLVKSPVLGFLGGVVDYVSHSRTLMFWLIGGSLGLYFAVQLGSLMVSRFWAQNAAPLVDNRGAGTEKAGHLVDQPGLGPANGAKIVATLTNAVDCQWKFSRTGGTNRIDQPESVVLDIGTELRAGQKLNLAAGLAELTFDSGAKVILTAPARFDVTDVLGGNLQRGKLTAKVPHSAIGFTVATPGGKVVDLGTEFGVKVNDDGVMDVVVYVGDVQVESGAGGTGSGGADQPKEVHVHAGQAVTVGPDHIAIPIPPENERFVRELAPLGDKSKAEAAYVEFMKSLKPVVWFRMEGKETDRVLHDEMGGQDAKLVWDGPGNPFVKGPIGKSYWLRGPQLKEYAIVPDYPKAEHNKLTISAWAFADSRPNYAIIASNWLSQFHFGLWSDDAGDSTDLSVRIAQPDGQMPVLREGPTHPFPINEWQHVAFVADGSTLHLYRQGREVASAKYAGLRFPAAVKELVIGAAGVPANRNAFWSGKLDEIAVFNDALSADDVKKLAGAAPR